MCLLRKGDTIAQLEPPLPLSSSSDLPFIVCQVLLKINTRIATRPKTPWSVLVHLFAVQPSLTRFRIFFVVPLPHDTPRRHDTTHRTLYHTTMAATVDDSFYRPDNPFMDRLLDTVYRHRAHKRQRSACLSKDSTLDAMPLFATTHSRQHLAPPSNLVRKRSDRNLASRHDVDDYLTSDELEVSFASNVSLNSPPRRSSGLPDCEPMDISPMPPPKSKGTSGLKGAGRPRALTSNNSRLFGSDLSNGSNPVHLTSKSTDGVEPKKAGTTTNRKLARSALPTEWMAAMLPPQPEPAQVRSYIGHIGE